jgi:hypothetical protein
MADMSAADINDLPDSDFAYIEDGGTMDSEGKTTPRSKRHFPVHDAAHAKNALDRLPTSPFGDKARPKVLAACKKFGIDVSESKAAQRDPAWEQRRRRWAGSLRGHSGRRSMRLATGCIEVRAKPDGTGGTNFQFLGYGSTFNEPFKMWDPWGDEYDEDVAPGAFTESLNQADLDVPFLVGHNDAGIPMARTTNDTLHLSQDSRGLSVDALMSGRRSDVRDLADAVERGDINEMSIGFVTRGQEWSPDWSTRRMTNLDLHRGDVSVVALAANPGTRGATMTALPISEAVSSSRVLEFRAQAEITDLSSSPDFNLAPVNGQNAAKCPYTKRNGCGQMCSGGSKFCPNCGGALYDSDGSIVLDDSGVTEEVGASGDADLLSRRLRLLELA